MQYPGVVICVCNEPNPASLQRRKLYRVAPRRTDDPRQYMRIIDDEDENYLYPSEWFMPIELPQQVIDALWGASTR